MRKRGGGKGGKLTDHSYSGQRTVPNTRAVYLPSSINLCFISKIVRIFWISLVLYILYTCVPGTVPYQVQLLRTKNHWLYTVTEYFSSIYVQ